MPYLDGRLFFQGLACDRAGFACGLIADGEDEVQGRRVGAGKLVPALAAQAVRGDAAALQQFNGIRIGRALGLAAGSASCLRPGGADFDLSDLSKILSGIVMTERVLVEGGQGRQIIRTEFK